jgi:hypothetical protein
VQRRKAPVHGFFCRAQADIQNELATEAVVAAVPFDTGSNLP